MPAFALAARPRGRAIEDDSNGKFRACSTFAAAFVSGSAEEALGRLNREPRAVSNDAAVVQTIITLARSPGLAVIAEEVETEAQRRFLERLGRPTCQGFLFSAPVDCAQFERLLSRDFPRRAPDRMERPEPPPGVRRRLDRLPEELPSRRVGRITPEADRGAPRENLRRSSRAERQVLTPFVGGRIRAIGQPRGQ